jgi:hypothetical protein
MKRHTHRGTIRPLQTPKRLFHLIRIDDILAPTSTVIAFNKMQLFTNRDYRNPRASLLVFQEPIRQVTMKRTLVYASLAAIFAGPVCMAQQPTGAAPPQAAGRGVFGGPIELGPDDKPAFPDPPAGFNVRRDNIPHGELTAVEYDSKSLGTRRRMRIYTPPGYSTARKYPVLYLLHDMGGTDTEWTQACHANVILDNLLADGKVQPMVLVFPDGNSSRTAADLANAKAAPAQNPEARGPAAPGGAPAAGGAAG